MKRTKEFKNAKTKVITVNDSRFGIRKLPMNQLEKPSVFTYDNPGRSWWGYN